ncbi:MAG TPA: M15 family metallopeptidase [Candidatus Mcinerneyibacterium sp.]|nr:M15 family metallopeptidase [Candidatus Mcinerneyibacterium sp.]
MRRKNFLFIIIFFIILLNIVYIQGFNINIANKLKIRNVKNIPEVINHLKNLNKKDLILLKLINKKKGLDESYTPDMLVKIPDKYCKNSKKIFIKNIVKPNLINMIESAEKDGVKLNILSGYRSYEYQRSLHNYYIEKYGKEYTEKISAKEGHSEHQLGTAVDLNSFKSDFKESEEFLWLKNNSYKFGFILSYPENSFKKSGYIFEPWHYRFIGKKSAKIVFYNFKNDLYEFLEVVDNFGGFND